MNIKPQNQSVQQTGQTRTDKTTATNQRAPYSTKTTINAPLNALNSDNLSMALRYLSEIGMTDSRLDSVIVEAEQLINAAKQIKADIKPAGSIAINPPRRRSLSDIMQEQAQQRGLEPLPLEPELLLKRIAQGGHSGGFLADAFFSAYRPDKTFQHSLSELIKLDAEAFRLFHQCLHIRHIRDWNDDNLYQLEQQINTILFNNLDK